MVAPSSFDEESLTFDVTFTTESPVRRYDWRRDQWYNEVLSFEPGHVNLSRLNAGAPVLDSHWSSFSVRDQLGVVEKAWLEKGQGGATIRLSKRDSVSEIVQDIKDGILRNISIGYEISKYQVEDAEQKGELPTYRATDWMPYEISLVTIPADAAAQVRRLEQGFQEVELIEPEVELSEDNTNHTAAANLRLSVSMFLSKNQ